MPVQHALGARAEAVIAAADDVGMPDIQPFKVPEHWPPAVWPQEQLAPEASADPGGGPAIGGAQAASAGFSGPADADPADSSQAWPRQFAVLLAEALGGVRPARQLRPLLSERGSIHLHRLLPLFADGHRPHVTRVLTTRPTRDVIEMTLIVTVGPRTRALAVRLERIHPVQRPAGSEKPAMRATRPPSSPPGQWHQWHCTDIEAA